MARFNEILVGRFNRALQKLTGIKGGPPAAQLATEIGAQIDFNQMGVDFRFLEGWNRFAGSAVTAAVAAQDAAVQLRNPAGSNVMAIVERFDVFEGAADQIIVTQNTNDAAALANVVGVRCLDNRAVKGSPNTLGAVLSLSFGNNIALIGGILFRLFVQANIIFVPLQTQDQQITLAPGDALWVFSSAVNVSIAVNMMWRERFLEDSERT